MFDTLKQHESRLADAICGQASDRDESCLRILKTHSKITPQLALEIYRNNTHGARADALEQVYPACASILGKTIFRSIAREFVLNDTAGCADLNTYGKPFDQHLGRLLAAGRLPGDFVYLPDLASLEYSYNSAYYADNDPPFDFDYFAQKATNATDIYFQLSQSLGLIASAYPIYQVWMANCYQHESSQIQTLSEMQYLVVNRDHVKPVVTPVMQCEYQLLEACTNKRSLQQLIDCFGCDVARMLPKMIAQKWIVGMCDNG